MNFVDRTLIALADPATRASLFDQLALGQLIDAAYLTENLTVQGPFNPLFDELRLGLGVPRDAIAEGYWQGAGGGGRTDARFELAGLGAGSAIRVDAVWRGSIVARTASPAGRITGLQTEWPTTAGIDEEIAAALGALPADPLVREQERRSRYRARLRAVLSVGEALDDPALDRWLRFAGAATVGELMTQQRGTAQMAVAQVTYTLAPAPPPSVTALAISAALLIRDAGVSLAELISDSKQVRERLSPSLGRAVEGPARLRQSVVIGWILPEAVFADADWPTETNPADPANQVRERRTLAGRWLAREGIGLIVR